MSGKLPVGRLLAEGMVIVVSVLLALWADAALASRQESAAVEQNLAALARDFDQMAVSLDTALVISRAGTAAASTLFEAMGSDPIIVADSAASLFSRVIRWRVFVPSTASYDALVASGRVERLRSDTLKAAMGDFFGSFTPIQSDQEALRNQLRVMLSSDAFIREVGFHRVVGAYEAGAVGLPVAQVRGWGSSENLKHSLAIQFANHASLDLKYRNLRLELERVRVLILDELRRRR